MLVPRNAWSDASAWEDAARALSEKFRQNFVPFANEAGEAVVQAMPAS
jgi:ATP-dependent phosphoenolpyruvate carboxykinase